MNCRKFSLAGFAGMCVPQAGSHHFHHRMRGGVVVDRARVEQSQGRKVMGVDGRVGDAKVQEVLDVRHETDSVSIQVTKTDMR